MKVLVKKMTKFGLLKLEIVIGIIIMALAIIGLPLGLLLTNPAILAEPMTWGVLLPGMLFFAFAGYLCFVRPYILYRKFPEVQAETDGEYLYIHANKEAKIRLADITEANVQVDLPYILQKEFIKEILMHFFSEKYGNVVLEIEGYGTYKMRFVAHAQDTADDLIRFIDQAMNKA